MNLFSLFEILDNDICLLLILVKIHLGPQNIARVFLYLIVY